MSMLDQERDAITGRIIQRIDSVAQDYHDPELIRAVLLHMETGTGKPNLYFKDFPEKFGISAEEFDKVKAHLLSSELFVRQGVESTERITFTDAQALTLYVNSNDIFPNLTILNRQGLTDDQVLAAMNAVSNDVEFCYENTFHFPAAQMDERKASSQAALELIRAAESKYFHNVVVVRIPPQFKGFPSFVGEADPRGHGSKDYMTTLRGEFATPEEAMSVGFSKAYGCPKTIYPHKQLGEVVNTLPTAVQVSRKEEESTLSLTDFMLDLTNYHREWRFGNYQEAKTVVPKLQAKLEEALAD